MNPLDSWTFESYHIRIDGLNSDGIFSQLRIYMIYCYEVCPRFKAQLCRRYGIKRTCTVNGVGVMKSQKQLSKDIWTYEHKNNVRCGSYMERICLGGSMNHSEKRSVLFPIARPTQHL